MGLEGRLLLTVLTALRVHNIGLFHSFFPCTPGHPTRPGPCPPWILSLSAPSCACPHLSFLPLKHPFLFSLSSAPSPSAHSPNSSLVFPEGSGISCQMLNPGLSCFVGEGRRLVSRQAPLLLGDGGGLRARPYQVSLSALGLLVEREKEGFGLLPCPSPLCGIVFPTLVLIFLPIAIFPNNPCREYVPSKSRRASLRPALVGDGTVLLYRC